MQPSIAVLAPGAMGAGIGRRLVEHGSHVLTSLAGRSAGSRARAAEAGMVAADDATIAGAGIILSVVPPHEAVAIAERFAPAMAAAAAKPVFVDCNAVDVRTVERVAAIVAATGSPFVDGCIIGAPPRPGKDGPRLYASGEAAAALGGLRNLGIDLRVMTGPIGTASALKMSYAMVSKGVTALGAAMVLAATRAGADEALRAELAGSQSELLLRFKDALPDMYPKAYRWSGEMREIAAFLANDPAAAAMFEGAAALYDRLAADFAGDRREIAAMDAFLAPVEASNA